MAAIERPSSGHMAARAHRAGPLALASCLLLLSIAIASRHALADEAPDPASGRVQLKGFSVTPPAAAGWRRLPKKEASRRGFDVLYVRTEPDTLHTMTAGAFTLLMQAKGTSSALLDSMFARMKRRHEAAGHQSIEQTASHDSSQGTERLRIRARLDDLAPGTAGGLSHLESDVRLWIHPESPYRVVVLDFSTRSRPGAQPLDVESERQAFFDGMRLSPLGKQKEADARGGPYGVLSVAFSARRPSGDVPLDPGIGGEFGFGVRVGRITVRLVVGGTVHHIQNGGQLALGDSATGFSSWDISEFGFDGQYQLTNRTGSHPFVTVGIADAHLTHGTKDNVEGVQLSAGFGYELQMRRTLVLRMLGQVDWTHVGNAKSGGQKIDLAEPFNETGLTIKVGLTKLVRL